MRSQALQGLMMEQVHALLGLMMAQVAW